MRIKWAVLFGLLVAVSISLQGEVVAHKSTTGENISYRELCENAALNESVFQKFRSIESYSSVVECGQSGEFADYIRNYATQNTLSLIPQFRKLDGYGNPTRNIIPGFGLFSGTTLRYVMVADHISRVFDLPENYTVVEVGAGFGGQAYILSQLLPFSQYYIFDLPEVEMLINKMMTTLSVRKVVCLEAHEEVPLDSFDLFISNYALTECDRNTQLDYFKRVIVKAKRGYILYNETSLTDRLSLADFIALFQAHGIHLNIYSEPVFSYDGNLLITWDRTKT